MNSLSSNSYNASDGGFSLPLEDPTTDIFHDSETTRWPALPIPYPGLCFDSGDLLVIASRSFFLVHRHLIARHSARLATLVSSAESSHGNTTENYLCSVPDSFSGEKPMLILEDAEEDIALFLKALYDGLPSLLQGIDNFKILSSLLGFCAKYDAESLAYDILGVLLKRWPTSLAGWDCRYQTKENFDPILDPLNPIMAVNLARQIGPLAQSLLPAALYELSTLSPSSVAAGMTYIYDGVRHQLSQEDLVALLAGRENCSRFLSTFVVNELQNRRPFQHCLHRASETVSFADDGDHSKKKPCQYAVERAMLELLKDCNGVVKGVTCDPLLAIKEVSDLVKDPDPRFTACDACAADLGRIIRMARSGMWRYLPSWFGLEPVANWGH